MFSLTARQQQKEKDMTVDFEALDLVRGENKSRSYHKRIDELQQQNTDLRELVADAIKMVKENEKDNFQAYSCILEARLEKIKKGS
tara:strand:- start:279 stop:536 length:258 start_codon:yes stop_codon:yes gene_type:complete